MSEEKPVKSLASRRCKEFFGLKPGETTQEFMAELRALTDKDRDDHTEAGMPTTRTGTTAQA